MQTILPEQRLLEIPARIDDILGYIPDEDVKASLASRFKARLLPQPGTAPSSPLPEQSGKSMETPNEDESTARWSLLKREVERAANRLKGLDKELLLGSVADIVFAHCFPRLDVEVSKHMNHLLKAPFCIHPKTGRVCVPIDPAVPDEFDPMVRTHPSLCAWAYAAAQTVPTIARLLNELSQPAMGGGDATMRHVRFVCTYPTLQHLTTLLQEDSDLEKTSLFQHVSVFRTAFLAPLVREVSSRAYVHATHCHSPRAVCPRAASQAGGDCANSGLVKLPFKQKGFSSLTPPARQPSLK